MLRENFVETILGGLRPIALLCKNHDDAVLLKEVVDSWSDGIIRASESKKLAATDNQQPASQNACDTPSC